MTTCSQNQFSTWNITLKTACAGKVMENSKKACLYKGLIECMFINCT